MDALISMAGKVVANNLPCILSVVGLFLAYFIIGLMIKATPPNTDYIVEDKH